MSYKVPTLVKDAISTNSFCSHKKIGNFQLGIRAKRLSTAVKKTKVRAYIKCR